MNNLLYHSQQFLKRNSATILTFVGGAGVVATAVLAVKATPKALRRIEEAKEEKGAELTKLEVVKVAAPSYVPTAAVGVSTLACIFGANVLNKRHQAALISAYALIDNSYKEYKKKLTELYGEEAHEKIVDAIAVEKSKDPDIHCSNLTSSCDLSTEEGASEPVLFYDEYSGRYFEAPIERVITAEYHLNRNFVLRGGAILNEFYDFLGLEPTEYGSTVGWAVEDEFYWIDFNHRKTVLDDGLEVYIIETPYGPSPDYDSYY